MRDWFTFHYDGYYYQRMAFPIGWAMYLFSFKQMMALFIREIRSYGHRALGYIDDFLVV